MSSTSSSPPTQTSPGGDINDNFFTPGSSPPLILAFLAIGLFSAAMVAVFGWRRVHTGRALARYGMMDPLGRHMGDGAGTGNGRKKVVDYGEPPKLWDLWTGSPRDGIRSGSQLRGVEEDLGFGVGNDTDIEVEKKNGKNWGFAMDDRGEEVRWDNLMVFTHRFLHCSPWPSPPSTARTPLLIITTLRQMIPRTGIVLIMHQQTPLLYFYLFVHISLVSGGI
ncbi:hypothetical protein K435DRAFT_159921 [Dendrothele bispora CBS 962.96]|uniref:Uncharacterized protein n=1 Tax=Dendrothele bispora (strain CBS 962.96) TaxID=1314807 RepID=A0A4S8MP28_DENBC|nr:hypothetical protein K435DRAFT_159921 [Dendrothele bispora CBS 962.96]